MTPLLAWVRTNVFTVIFLGVTVAALLALPFISRHLNGKVRENMANRVSMLRELDSLEKTEVRVGNPVSGRPESRRTLVNERLLRRYQEVTETERRDAELVQAAALAHNRKGRTVLLDELFPDPPANRWEMLPRQFHSIVMEAHDDLLRAVRAGAPPAIDELREKLEHRRQQFLVQTLAKDVGDPLDANEQEELNDVLSKARRSQYAEAAESVGLYADAGVLNLPVWDQARRWTMSEMFEWQWQYWIVEDILQALSVANEQSGSVLQAPAKRLLEITIWPDVVSAGAAAPGGRMGMGSGGGQAQPPAAAPADPAQEAQADYARSFTGRVSNPLYDVRDVRVRLVVDTARLPAVIDALAGRNFITVLDLDLVPVDSHAAAREGYLYGNASVAEVTLHLETLWLRAWTAALMPEEIKRARGIPVAPPAGAVPAG